MKSAQNAIEVLNLSKTYPLAGSHAARLRHMLSAGRRSAVHGIHALRNVSLTVARGEAFGIIGANGSGKSTLLQIIAGILQPTSGAVEVHGRLSALLELGAGFSPEFTGRENVYLNASLLGLSRPEIDDRLPEIIRFAGIGDFLDQPIRTYSTGMVLRLAFSVAAHVDPEVLIVDEALAVGDIAFRQRCMRKVHELRARGVTILFVSHESGDVKALCDRCVWLEGGAIREIGSTDDVVGKYLSATFHRETVSDQADRASRHQATAALDDRAVKVPQPGAEFEPVIGFGEPLRGYRYGDRRAEVTGAVLLDEGGLPVRTVPPFARCLLRMSFRVNPDVCMPIAGFLVRNGRGESIFGSNTARENHPLASADPGAYATVEFHWSMPELAPGTYRISVAVSDGTLEEFRVCDYIEDAIDFEIPFDPQAPVRGYLRLHCDGINVHTH